MKKIILLIFLMSFQVSGVYGQARFTDGVDDYIRIPTISEDIFYSEHLTFECWFYYIAPGNFGLSHFLKSRDVTAQWFRIFIGDANPLSSLNINFKDNDQAWAKVQKFKWYHFAVTIDTNTYQFNLYVNGVLEWAHIQSGFTHSATVPDLRIQGDKGDILASNIMDELRIWNVVRTTEQIKSFMFKSIPNKYPHLLLNYHFDEVQGNLFDSSGYNNNATDIVGTTAVQNVPYIKRIIGGRR